ncbi:MAG: GtrA family protein [Oscillospiraceae bacterium]|nr:GtrA family protein [Oscillospiraceae bacterium]
MKELFVLFFSGRWRELFLQSTENPWINLFRYCFVGGVSFLIDFAVYALLVALGIPYLLAGVFSFTLGFLFNFFAGRFFIFAAGSKEKADKKELISVLVIALIGLGLTELLLYIGVAWLGLDKRLAKIIAAILVLFWNYTARKLFVYKKN